MYNVCMLLDIVYNIEKYIYYNTQCENPLLGSWYTYYIATCLLSDILFQFFFLHLYTYLIYIMYILYLMASWYILYLCCIYLFIQKRTEIENEIKV